MNKEARPWYLGVYATDDFKAQKRCNAIVLYGIPNWKEGNPTEENSSNGVKHVDLYCPTCDFVHNFKRQEWSENHIFETMGDYVVKGAVL